MTASEIWGASARRALPRIAQDLHAEFRGEFNEETVERVVRDTYEKLLAKAIVTRWIVLSAERIARERLHALAHAETQSPVGGPVAREGSGASA